MVIVCGLAKIAFHERIISRLADLGVCNQCVLLWDIFEPIIRKVSFGALFWVVQIEILPKKYEG